MKYLGATFLFSYELEKLLKGELFTTQEIQWFTLRLYKKS